MEEGIYIWRVGEGAWKLWAVNEETMGFKEVTITFDGQKFSCSCGRTNGRAFCEHVLYLLKVVGTSKGYYDLYHSLVLERQAGVQTQQPQRQSYSTRKSTTNTTKKSQGSQEWEEVVEQIRSDLSGIAEVDVEGNELIIIKKNNLKDWQWKKLWSYIQALGAKKVKGKNYAWHVPITDAVKALRG